MYLPQIVYAARPNLEACEQALELTKRARHPVRQHLRRSPTCSEKARLLAVQFGLPVPAGYTFVQPHWRGEGTARPTLYRSRSALACLHALQPQSAPKAGLRGLGFLEQVRDDLERHGHQVLSVTNYFGPNVELPAIVAVFGLKIGLRRAAAAPSVSRGPLDVGLVRRMRPSQIGSREDRARRLCRSLAVLQGLTGIVIPSRKTQARHSGQLCSIRGKSGGARSEAKPYRRFQ